MHILFFQFLVHLQQNLSSLKLVSSPVHLDNSCLLLLCEQKYPHHCLFWLSLDYNFLDVQNKDKNAWNIMVIVVNYWIENLGQLREVKWIAAPSYTNSA